MSEIKATVSRTVEVEMKPLLAFCYFDEGGKRKIRCQYGEYHDGVLHRPLAMQEAPESDAGPILDAVYGAMQAKAAATLAGMQGKDPAEYDDNERYLAALLQAAQS